MKEDLLITGISQLVTAEGAGPKRGRAMREVKLVEHAAIAVSNGIITWTGKERDWTGQAATTVNVGGCAVVPGLVDPHTHSVWAGDRLNDFEARTSGSTYESILAAGGGIRSTIRATAMNSPENLVALAKPRVESLIHSGATTIEIKSGYGFTPAAELAMLEVIHSLSTILPARIVPTLLIHIPPVNDTERARYVTQICEELIPEIAGRKLATSVDVFVEKEAWSAVEAEQMFRAAKQHGLAIKLHSDQFHCIGGVELGIRFGALSIDHLEASGPKQIAEIAASSTIATILPGVSLHLGDTLSARSQADRRRGCCCCWNGPQSGVKPTILNFSSTRFGGSPQRPDRAGGAGCGDGKCGLRPWPHGYRPRGSRMSRRFSRAPQQRLARTCVCVGNESRS